MNFKAVLVLIANEVKTDFAIWLHNEFWVFDSELIAWAVTTKTEFLRERVKELAAKFHDQARSCQCATTTP